MHKHFPSVSLTDVISEILPHAAGMKLLHRFNHVPIEIRGEIP